MGERLGVFGGTFDPVHVGHLVAAVNAGHALRLDRVLLVVANEPWQKGDRTLTPAEDRLAMVSAAVAGCRGLAASRLEIDRGGDSVTADTLEALLVEDPTRELFLIVGSDVASTLDTWRRAEATAQLATLVVVNRPGAPEPAPSWPGRVVKVAIPNFDLSSSDLRARAAEGRPLDYLVPDAAIDVIGRRGLYSGDR
ncbi:MAG: nicotinate-nucleotide adenylyltransferase [Pseudonocardiaceae bacterium]